MAPRFWQRCNGLALFLLGAGLTADFWWIRPPGPPAVLDLGAAFPFLGVLGLAMVLLPGPKAERIQRGDDLWGVNGLRVLTVRWWIVIALGLAAGAGYFLLLLQHWR